MSKMSQNKPQTMFSVRLYNDDIKRIEAIAEKENRSFNNVIQTVFFKMSKKLEDDVVNKGQQLIKSLNTINPTS